MQEKFQLYHLNLYSSKKYEYNKLSRILFILIIKYVGVTRFIVKRSIYNIYILMRA